MPFQFSLRALLRLRHIEEQRERLRLKLLNSSRARVRHEYEEVGRAALVEFEQLDHRLRDGLAGAELLLGENTLQASRKRRQELTALIETLERQIQKQISSFSESQKKRKILESLRERELRAYQQIENRREQQRIDDAFARRSNPHST